MATITLPTLTGTVNYYGKTAQTYSISSRVEYTYTTNSDNSMTFKVTTLSATYSASAWGGGVVKQCDSCCGTWGVKWWNGSYGKSWTLSGSTTGFPTGTSTFSTNRNLTFTLAPGKSAYYTMWTYVQGSCGTCCERGVTFSNNNSAPTPPPTPPSPTYPTLSVSCSGASSPYSVSFSANVSYGYCSNQRNSTTWMFGLNNSFSIGGRSGTGTSSTITGLVPNTRYYVGWTSTNGCLSRSAACNTVTITPNTLSEATALTHDTGRVKLAVTNGGGEYNPSTTIYIAKCGTSNWRAVEYSSTKSIEYITLTGLEPETCYQVQARTSTPAGTYTGNTVTLTTPKKDVCIVEITDIDVTMNDTTLDVCANICYEWETTTVPSKMTLYYHVKDGYDTIWKQVELPDATTLTGTGCKEICGLYPNQTVYEAYIHSDTGMNTWDSQKREFITPLVPEPVIHNCATYDYLAKLICQAVIKLYDGKKTIYINDCTKERCDPDSEDPTLLTLWSRFLRFAHAVHCLACEGGSGQFIGAKPNQYFVGEIGWQDMLDTVVSPDNDDSWRLVESGAIKDYIDKKLHEVWHYHGAVDYILDDLNNVPTDAKIVINLADNKVYEKVGGEWVVATSIEQPDDFAVYHINKASTTTKYGKVRAESAYYYFEGSWNLLDGNIADIEAAIDYLWEHRNSFITGEADKTPNKVSVTDKDDFDCDNYENNTNIFITEPTDYTGPAMRTIKFNYGDNAIVSRTQDVVDGAYAHRPPEPKRIGYTFNGWVEQGQTELFDWTTEIHKDYTLEALWSKQTIVVTFDINGGTGTDPEPIYGEYGDVITLPSDIEFSKEGAEFLGWSYNGVKFEQGDIATGNIDLKAIWSDEPVSGEINPKLEVDEFVYNRATGKTDLTFSWWAPMTGYHDLVLVSYSIYDDNDYYFVKNEQLGVLDSSIGGKGTVTITDLPAGERFTIVLTIGTGAVKLYTEDNRAIQTEKGQYIATTRGGTVKLSAEDDRTLRTQDNKDMIVSRGTSMSESLVVYSPVDNAAFTSYAWDALRRNGTMSALSNGAKGMKVEAGYRLNTYDIGSNSTNRESGNVVVKDLKHGNGEILYLKATPLASDKHEYEDQVWYAAVYIPNPIIGILTPRCESGRDKQYIVDIVEKKENGNCTDRWQTGDRVVVKRHCETPEGDSIYYVNVDACYNPEEEQITGYLTFLRQTDLVGATITASKYGDNQSQISFTYTENLDRIEFNVSATSYIQLTNSNTGNKICYIKFSYNEDSRTIQVGSTPNSFNILPPVVIDVCPDAGDYYLLTEVDEPIMTEADEHIIIEEA